MADQKQDEWKKLAFEVGFGFGKAIASYVIPILLIAFLSGTVTGAAFVYFTM